MSDSSSYVTIGIPFYNSEHYLESAIKSVLLQTYENWELILIDDGSTDKSLDIAKFYESKDNRIRVISDGKNKKLPARLNQIIDESKFEYIARMDADDMMHPERISKQINFLKINNLDVASTSYYAIDSKDTIVAQRNVSKNSFFLDDFVLGNYYICHPSIMAKKEWFVRNRYDENFDRAEDYELWFRALLNNDFNIKVMEDVLMFYREDGSYSPTKQIKSYQATNLMFKFYKNSIPKFLYLKGVFRNYFKIILIKFFYSKKLERLILKRRNKFNPSIGTYIDQQFVIKNIKEYK